MGNLFPSFGHAERYLRDYITTPLRDIVTTPPSPPPTIPAPTAPPPPQNDSQASEAERRRAADNAERHRPAHTADSRGLQRAKLARVETEAATHLGTQGVLDDAEGEGGEQHSRHVHLDTAPVDPRWVGRPDQSAYCWSLYNSYLKCIERRSVLDEHCLFLKKCSVAMCPCDLIALWTEERRAGRWFGVPVPYHKGEMDLAELEEELETDDKEEKEAEEEATGANEQRMKRLEERLVTEADPAEDVARTGEPVVIPPDEVVSVATERACEAVGEAGVEPLPEGVEDVRERERREALRLWEELQARREGERSKLEEHERKRMLDIKEIVRHAMTAIHK